MRIKKFSKIDSTQNLVLELAKKGERPWLVVVAKEQTGGRGRGKNFWYSPLGGLYFSILLPPFLFENLQLLTNLAAFFVAKVVFEEWGEKIFIKFPNDLYFQNKKIGGILTENVICGKEYYSVLGIGLNTNIKKFPEDLKGKATSLYLATGKKIDNEKILKKILDEIKEGIKIFTK
jgi:BirA family biotin operon repressor/biotin-[acetyl-CoA-carboxylase] ligase